jgi:hypothetical protein
MTAASRFGKHTLIPMSPREVLTAIHRGKDALINIEGPHGPWVVEDGERKRQWKVLASNTVDGLLTCPTIAPWLMGGQAYFSLASVFRAPWRKYKSSVTRLSVYSRCELEFLNCISVDIDIAHTEGARFDFETQAQEVLDFTLTAGLPYPSIICDSGRGMWLHCPIKDRLDPSQPLTAHGNLQMFHSRLLSAAVAAYRRFNAGTDSSCTDSQRVARFPGSINTASGTRARYFRTSDQIFTISELADGFGVKPRKTVITKQEVETTECTGKSDCKCGGQRYDDDGKPKRPVCATMRAQAALLRWRLPLAGLRQLAEIRGRFKTGQRHVAAYLFASIGKRAKIAKLQHETECFANLHCPGLPWSDIKECVKSARKSHLHISNDKIVEMLRITGAERAQLSPWLKPNTPSKRAEITFRRSILAAELELRGSISIRQAVYVYAKRGVVIGRSQVAEDLKHIKATTLSGGSVTAPRPRYFTFGGRARTQNPENFACSVGTEQLDPTMATTGTSKKNRTVGLAESRRAL